MLPKAHKMITVFISTVFLASMLLSEASFVYGVKGTNNNTGRLTGEGNGLVLDNANVGDVGTGGVGNEVGNASDSNTGEGLESPNPTLSDP